MKVIKLLKISEEPGPSGLQTRAEQVCKENRKENDRVLECACITGVQQEGPRIRTIPHVIET